MEKNVEEETRDIFLQLSLENQRYLLEFVQSAEKVEHRTKQEEDKE